MFRSENILPSFVTTLEDQTIPLGSVFTFLYEGTDSDGDVLRYELINPPLGAAIDPTGGRFTFSPVGTGVFEIQASISDGSDVVFSESALLTVRPSNVPPVFGDELAGDFLIMPSQSIEFVFSATDEDGDVLTFGLVNPPAGAEIDPVTGVFSFVPEGEGAFEIIVSVTDGQNLVTSSKATIVVRLENEGPSFTSELDDRKVEPGDTLFFVYQAEDPDDDSVSYRLLESVDEAAIDSVSGAFTFLTSEAGLFAITIVATDGLASDTSNTAIITVNTPPTFTSVLEDQELTSASIPFVFTYEAADVEGDTLVFEIEDPPDGATLDGGGHFEFNPSSFIVGEYDITVYVSDGVDTTKTVATLSLVSGIQTEENPAKLKRTLYPHFPNPVTSSAVLRFSLPESGVVRLVVYDVLGREMRVLVDERRGAGEHEVLFSALDLPSGTYFYRLETPTGPVTRSMLVIR